MFEAIVAKAAFVGESTEIPYTVLIGIASVFAGLICIIIMCKIIGLFCGSKSSDAAQKANAVTETVAVKPQAIENRQEIIAAVSAALAEELGTDVSAIRILSFKKL